MTLGDIHIGGDTVKNRTRFDGTQSDGYIVRRMNVDKIRHESNYSFFIKFPCISICAAKV